VQFFTDFHENFINVECIAVTLLLTFQSPGVDGAEFNAQQAKGLKADINSTLGKQLCNLSMDEFKPLV